MEVFQRSNPHHWLAALGDDDGFAARLDLIHEGETPGFEFGCRDGAHPSPRNLTMVT
jgi:hypothetical protein